MEFSDILALIGGLCLFLFGMQLMGNALERCAGSKLSSIISRLTTNKMAGFLTGLGVTAVIQSSSATTVMVVGFVNSGVMTLKQAINVIMGANVGTTVTAWILSLSGIESSNFFVSMFKPTNFTPILALIGIFLYMGAKKAKKKDIGVILLGFATLMFGMDAMSSSVAGLENVEGFRQLLVAFKNPILGVLAGAVFTAIIQSSSASVGVLQALSSTGQVSIGAAIPIIFGQNIGTCVTAMLSSTGATRNARRAALVHLSFNIIGCTMWLAAVTGLDAIFDFAFMDLAAGEGSIAIVHTLFNIGCTVVLLPMAGLLERLAYKILPENEKKDIKEELLDERLLATPAFAIENCRKMSVLMADAAVCGIKTSFELFSQYDEKGAELIREKEDKTDIYEDKLGTYLVRLSAMEMSARDSNEATKMLHMIGDLERIGDYAVNIAESVEEIREKEVVFSPQGRAELGVLFSAVGEIVERTYNVFVKNDISLAKTVEPLEEVIDNLKDQIRIRHVLRLQTGDCSLSAGFVLSDILTSLERVSDHCSNIAGCALEMQHNAIDLHEYLGSVKISNEEFKREFEAMQEKYSLPNS